MLELRVFERFFYHGLHQSVTDYPVLGNDIIRLYCLVKSGRFDEIRGKKKGRIPRGLHFPYLRSVGRDWHRHGEEHAHQEHVIVYTVNAAAALLAAFLDKAELLIE